MNKILLYAMRFNTDGLEPVAVKFLDSNPDVVKPDNSILDYIFGVDPVSGLPIGDLSVYLGDDANPEIRNFIERNLMQPLPDSGSGMNLPTEVVNQFRTLSDDDVALFSRNHGESREEYADRLRLYFANEKVQRVKRKSDADFKRTMDEISSKLTR